MRTVVHNMIWDNLNLIQKSKWRLLEGSMIIGTKFAIYYIANLILKGEILVTFSTLGVASVVSGVSLSIVLIATFYTIHYKIMPAIFAWQYERPHIIESDLNLEHKI